MKGDFSQLLFTKEKRFSRVFMQQGRVQLDADWNEQGAIFLDAMRSLTADVIGPHAGDSDTSFKIEADATGFLVKRGRYYVHGIGCTNPQDYKYGEQTNYSFAESKNLKAGLYLVYLDVWERHIAAAEDDDIREVALGGAETASRGEVVWQVKTLPLESHGMYETRKRYIQYAEDALDRLRNGNRGRLRASVSSAHDERGTPYRGIENQLYRVEIHQGTDGQQHGATFKWSRENGSVAFPIQQMEKLTVTLSYFGNDSRGGLNIDDWVEILDDRDVLSGLPGDLHQIEDINHRGMDAIVTLKGDDAMSRSYGEQDPHHPILRRWDHGESTEKILPHGAIAIREGTTANDWIELEDGIVIQFCPSANGQPNVYRSGDYWMIPARTAVNNIVWNPAEQAPHGVDHYYAPLAIITSQGNGSVCVEHDCRYVFRPLGVPVEPSPKWDISFLGVLALTLASALMGAIWFLIQHSGYGSPMSPSPWALLGYTFLGGCLGFVISSLFSRLLRW